MQTASQFSASQQAMPESPLKDTPLFYLIATKVDELVYAHVDDKVEDFSNLLKERNILSAPVYDSKNSKWVGIVDALDIVRYTALGFFEQKVFQDNLFEQYEFPQKTIGDLIKMSRRAQNIIALKQGDTLETAMHCLGEQSHRLLVERVVHLYSHDDKTTGKVYRMLSQTDIIKFLIENLNKLGKYQESLLTIPIKQIHL